MSHYQQVKHICWLVLSACFFALAMPAYAEGSSADEGTFLTLTDFHFDPFLVCHNTVPCPVIKKLQSSPSKEWSTIFEAYEKAAPQYRQDTNYNLLVTSLAAAKKTAKERQIKFVIVLGDFLGHEFRDYYKKYTRDNSFKGYQAFVKKTMEFLNDELERTFPDIDVYNVIGNNDSYHRDYISIANGQFLKDTGMMWSRLIKTNQNKQAMINQFPVGGYYSVSMPGNPQMRLIVLNSVLFSYQALSKYNDKWALDELNWLHHELESVHAHHQKALILMHIPPGIDVYATLKVRIFRLIDLWKLKFTKIFEDDLQEFAPEMAGILCGHLHSHWTQILTLDSAHAIPVSGTSSISPIFGNNPGFKVFTYSIAKQELENSDAYVYPMNRQNSWNIIYRYPMTPTDAKAIKEQFAQN